MKALNFVAGLAIAVSALTAQAAPNSAQIKSVLEAQKTCGSFVRVDNANVYLGFAQYKYGSEEPRAAIPAHVNVAPLNGAEPFSLATNDGALDMITDGSTAYILTYTSIEEWNLDSKTRVSEYPTTTTQGALEYKQHASQFVRYKNELVIAHGRFGLTFFDLKTKKITSQMHLIDRQLPVESQATGITVQDNLAFITLDGYSLFEPGHEQKVFRGIVVVDLDTNTQVGEMDGLDPGATSIVSDANRAIVSFGGNPLWKFNLHTLATTKSNELPSPLLRLFKFPMKGHPVGSAAMDDQYYYTCYSTPPPSGSGLMIHAPLALDRALVGLD